MVCAQLCKYIYIQTWCPWGKGGEGYACTFNTFTAVNFAHIVKARKRGRIEDGVNSMYLCSVYNLVHRHNHRFMSNGFYFTLLVHHIPTLCNRIFHLGKGGGGEGRGEEEWMILQLYKHSNNSNCTSMQ